MKRSKLRMHILYLTATLILITLYATRTTNTSRLTEFQGESLKNGPTTAEGETKGRLFGLTKSRKRPGFPADTPPSTRVKSEVNYGEHFTTVERTFEQDGIQISVTSKFIENP